MDAARKLTIVGSPFGSTLATRSPGRMPKPARVSAILMTCSRKHVYVTEVPVSGITTAIDWPGAVFNREGRSVAAFMYRVSCSYQPQSAICRPKIPEVLGLFNEL